MKNESGKSIVILVILIILIIIGTSIAINYAKQILEESDSQDLITNMLLMQAETRKGVEEVCFQTVNLNENKEEDIIKINEIKQEYLEGIILNNAPVGVQDAVKNIPSEICNGECYYLDNETLNEIGIQEIDSDKHGYFIVKYDFINADVEVINTNGYEGCYTLTEILEIMQEEQS